MSAIILAVRRQDSGDRIQETGFRRQDSGDRRLFFIYSPHFPTSPLPHFPIPFKQDLVLFLKSGFLLTD
jgi:hypothetical protein